MKELYALLADMTARGEAGAVATVIRTDRSAPRHEGSKLILRADGTLVGSVGGGALEALVISAAREAMADGRCRQLRFDLSGELSACGGEVEVFVEPLVDLPPCWILGAGHVGRAVARLGRDLPFNFTVVDDRADLLAGLAPARGLAARPADLATHLRPTARTLVLCATRGHLLDTEFLEALFALERETGVEAAWVGVMGSRTKAAQLRRRFTADPRQAERWSRVAVPVGLAIGAETPAELALSILAEMLAVTRGVPWLKDAAGRPLGVFHQSRRPLPAADGADSPSGPAGTTP
ncbi:MAG: XdhC family protein [Candidatus Krumholzibacteriia bacterium]